MSERAPLPPIPRQALRFTSGLVGKGLLVLLGVGVGLAASTYFIEEEVAELAVDTPGIEATGPGGSVTTVPAQGEPTVRYENVKGTQGSETDGSEGQEGGLGSAAEQAALLNPADYKCEPGKNGGATDDGVTGNAINVAANYVAEGTGASFLREARDAVKAVLDEANVEGICGRKILLTDRNDKWDRNLGFSYIQNYVDSKMFALVVNPSSEGLDQAIITGEIDRFGIPVVGSDGMIISQYRWPKDSSTPGQAKWVWPVAASTVSTMHIMVQQAVAEGARTFGLVYDKRYRFGVEGAEAFENAIKRLQGEVEGINFKSERIRGIEPGQTSYGTEAEAFNNQCGTDANRECDLVAMLLDPSTAKTWIAANGTFGKLMTAGPQTLFNRQFAEDCVNERKKIGQSCRMIVWTGYNPPVGQLRNLPGVSKYVNQIQQRNARIDPENSFTEGAYLGAQVFVEALLRMGPNVTRENLRLVMDSMAFDTDLANDLRWSETNHFANTSMQAFEISSTPEAGFTGWSPKASGWVTDRWVGQI